jgi:small subunit ribosomal protein S8
MTTNKVADLLARMQNAIQRTKETVDVYNTKINNEILRVLKEEEMIEDYEIGDTYSTATLKYDRGEPVVTTFKMISKPGQRIYVSTQEIVPVLNGRGISIISTSEGVMTGAMAKGKKIGGELICKVW